MIFIDRLERRCGFITFPGFLRYYALMHVLVFVVQFLQPDLGQMLEFDRERILSGEVWRVITLFFATSQFGRVSPMALVFLYFGVMFVFMVSDGLEAAWGTFKTTLFCYTGMLLIILLNFIYAVPIPSSGTVLYGAAFFAFATLFPRVEILLFFVIPVQVRFLGMLAGGLLLYRAIGQPWLLPFYLVAYLNYFLWAAIPALRGTARLIDSGKRGKIFHVSKLPATNAFHSCVICGKTDITDPQAEFRTASNGQDYCADHLPE